jgi:hypothetical protein
MSESFEQKPRNTIVRGARRARYDKDVVFAVFDGTHPVGAAIKPPFSFSQRVFATSVWRAR